jgi:methylthioribose-1-phosphate isomerase
MRDFASFQLSLPKTIEIKKDCAFIIDQLVLPKQLRFKRLDTYQDCIHAIKTMRIRGAQAIGACGAAGLYLAARAFRDKSADRFGKYMDYAAQEIIKARPTAVNLAWAVKNVLDSGQGPSLEEMREKICAQAVYLLDKEEKNNISLGKYGASLLESGMKIQTHCNAGSLSGVWFGTATAPIYSAWLAGKNLKIWVDETRPMLQGSRLTAWELSRVGIDYSINVDSASGYLMAHKSVDAVIVGADRIASNGDVANKIGTYPLALMAKEHGIPFYVAAVNSTIDFNTVKGSDIKIEIREDEEITDFTHYLNRDIAPKGADSYNPVFDITPAKLITAFITQSGIYKPHELARIKLS